MLAHFLPLLLWRVIEGAVDIFTVFCLALASLEHIWMILALFPSVAVLAEQPVLASVLVCPIFVLVSVPVRTLDVRVGVLVRFAPVVLPVVSEHTYFSGMIILVIWAPRSFEVEHVEVSILLKLVNEIY